MGPMNPLDPQLPDSSPIPSVGDSSVDIQGVTKRFGSVTALEEVNLSIKKGEFFSLLGPSGCGKTTLLRLIGGFEIPSTGRVLIDGEMVRHQSTRNRHTKMIFQHLALFPHMNVFENIAFGLRMKGLKGDDVSQPIEKVLALVRLSGFEERRVEQLSGGQKQRVAMARALVNEPSVLLLDEPLGALDLQLRLQMMEELRRLHKVLKSTFIYVTHDQGEAMTMSDRIGVMENGRLLQVGAPHDIYERPQTRFVATFIGHSNLLPGRVTSIGKDRRASVDCDGAQLEAIAPDHILQGDSVTLSLRFEKITLNPPSTGRIEHCLPGTISKRTYMGPMIRYETTIANGQVLTADVANVEDQRIFEEGENLSLSWAEGSIVIVKE